jgi:ankyrin repeat protein
LNPCTLIVVFVQALPSQQDCRGHNALHYAAAAGNSTALQHLLDIGGSELFFSRPPDHDQQLAMTTPLHLAAYYGHADALLILMAKFRNVEVLDGQGRSALYLASHAGD